MNKISLVRDAVIKKGEFEINFDKASKIKVLEKTVLHSNVSPNNIEILLEDKANLIFYQIKEVTDNIHIKFTLKKASLLNYNLLLLNKGHNKVIIDILMPNNDAYANIKVRGINLEDNSNLDLIVNGVVDEKTKNNELIEDLKGLIINDGTIKISPNMMVHTNEVLANHFVTIGTFDKEELFYLTMRGISEDKAKTLLKQAFLTNIMSDFLKEKMEVIINE